MLVAAVIGSGIAAQRLSPTDVGLAALREHRGDRGRARRDHPRPGRGVGSAPEPGRHARRPRARRARPTAKPRSTCSQIVGGALGAVVANLMFGEAAVTWSTHHRATGAHLLGEVVATFGLVLVVFGVVRSGRAAAAPFAVAAYIAAAYWFTSSTSFANPAVTLAHALEHVRRHRAELGTRVHRRAARRWRARARVRRRAVSRHLRRCRRRRAAASHEEDLVVTAPDPVTRARLRTTSRTSRPSSTGSSRSRRSSVTSPRASINSPSARPAFVPVFVRRFARHRLRRSPNRKEPS